MRKGEDYCSVLHQKEFALGYSKESRKKKSHHLNFGVKHPQSALYWTFRCDVHFDNPEYQYFEHGNSGNGTGI